MKKALFVPIVFTISLVLCAICTAGVFQLYFYASESVLLLSPVQFGNLAAYFFPFSMLIATIIVFEFVLRKNVHGGFAVLFLTVLIIAALFIFYRLAAIIQKQNTDVIFNAIKALHTDRSFFLQSFFTVTERFFSDCVTAAQTHFPAFLIFSGSFWCAVLSYFAVAQNCTNWKLANFLLLVAMIIGTLYLYSALQSNAVQNFASKTFLHRSGFPVEALALYSIAALVFLFFLIRSLVRRHYAKKRSSI